MAAPTSSVPQWDLKTAVHQGLASAIQGARLTVGMFRCFKALDAAKLIVLRELGRVGATHAQLKQGCRAISVRPANSDLVVALQVFGSRHYELDDRHTAAIRELSEIWIANGMTPVVVDAGANVGCSTLFLADTYPKAVVVALEPDPATFDVLRTNVGGHPRILAENVALWSDDQGVAIHDGGDHQSWSNRVDASGEKRVPSRTLEQVVASVPNGRLLVAKLDIEGAEREACQGCIDLLRNTPCIVIEPHDWLFPGKSCLSGVLAAVAGGGFDVVVSGENIFFMRSDLFASESSGSVPSGIRPVAGVAHGNRDEKQIGAG